MKKHQDLVGIRYGKLQVKKFSHSRNGRYWECLCDCGKETVVSTRSLNYGSTRSCGCGSLAAARKNMQKRKVLPYPFSRKLKDLYRNMKDRCLNPLNKRWFNYGGRGIRVCDEWLNNRYSFYKWATDSGYRPGVQIDRIDVNGHYSPSNCRFVDSYVQMNNTTRNRLVCWDGKTMTVAQWARFLGVRGQALQHRFTRKWPLEKIMKQPFRNRD